MGLTDIKALKFVKRCQRCYINKNEALTNETIVLISLKRGEEVN